MQKQFPKELTPEQVAEAEEMRAAKQIAIGMSYFQVGMSKFPEAYNMLTAAILGSFVKQPDIVAVAIKDQKDNFDQEEMKEFWLRMKYHAEQYLSIEQA